jgi:uncharacterized damage-inducible protein DinB
MHRKNAVNAILNIYKQVIQSLKHVIKDIPDHKLIVVTYPESTNGCESLQAILSHVIHSGFGYATSIHNSRGNQLNRPEKSFHLTIKEYLEGLSDMYNYTEKIFLEITDEELEKHDPTKKIMTNWGQLYDIEQLMEHAITHVMRHQRQIEQIKLTK